MIIAVPAGDNTRMVGQYLMEKVPGLQFSEGLYTAFAFLAEDKQFVGGAVVSNFRRGQYGNDCEISVAAETAMAFRPHVCRAVFEYIFVQLNCIRCTAITTRKNDRGRRFVEGIGFTLEGNVRRGYDGKRNALIYGLLRDECRFLAGGLNGEEIGARSANAA